MKRYSSADRGKASSPLDPGWTGITVASRHVLQRDQQGRTRHSRDQPRHYLAERGRRSSEESFRSLASAAGRRTASNRARTARQHGPEFGRARYTTLCGKCESFRDRSGGAELLREAILLSQKASDETLTLSYLLYPPTLDYAGLRSALEWYIEGFTQRSKVKVDLDVSIGPDRLAEIVERTLFRVVQESLTNIFRHSGSETASVRIALESGGVRLEVADGGKGIPDEVLAALNSSGGQWASAFEGCERG